MNQAALAAGIQAAHFLEDAGGLQGLGVGDVHGAGAPRAPLRQLVNQSRGGQMKAALCKLGFLAAEGRFNHQHGEVHGIEPLPKRRVGAGVAAEGPPAARAQHGVAHRRDRMYGGQYFNGNAGGLQGLPHGNGLKAQKGRLWAGQAAEVRPDGAVEHMGGQRSNGFRQSMDGDGIRALGAYGIQHQR